MNYSTLISAADLNAMRDGADTVILDCRFNLADPGAGHQAYLAGHLPGAYYADLNRDLSAPLSPASGRHPLPDPAHLVARFSSWGIDAGKQVVVYDDMGGAMAARCWWLLRWLGHNAVALLDGGVMAWQQHGLPLATETVPAGAACFEPRIRSDWVVASEQIALNLSQPAFTLVDARAAERFRGEVEPIDPVAGHIPAALNRPLQLNLGEDGCFKSADQLAAEWSQLLGATEPRSSVMMCGSGVTACHHLLALEHAGLKGARLYAGSWSEWITDPDHAVSTGDE